MRSRDLNPAKAEMFSGHFRAAHSARGLRGLARQTRIESLLLYHLITFPVALLLLPFMSACMLALLELSVRAMIPSGLFARALIFFDYLHAR